MKKHQGLELTGRRFGRLEVLRLADRRTKDSRLIWECRCDCGVELMVLSKNLQSGWTRSCGCLRKELASNSTTKYIPIDITGRKFWRLTVLRRHNKPSTGQQHALWECSCECGTKSHVVASNSLRSGRTKSCGCIRREICRLMKTHKETWREEAKKRNLR
jgi:hypothetical protein